MARIFWHRTTDRPGMFALAFLLVASAIIQLSGIGLTADALEGLMPEWAFTIFASAYGLAGGMILYGMLRDKLNYEAAGDALAASGVFVRVIAVITVLPFSTAVAANAALLIVLGATFAVRFVQCLKGEHIVRVDQQLFLRAREEEDDDGHH